MSEKPLSDTEYNVLRETLFYLKRHGVAPKTKEMARKFNVGESAISNAKTSLKRNGYLDRHNLPTITGIEFIKHRNDIVPLQVPFLGYVKAGKTKTSDIRVDLRNVQELDDPDIPTIMVPKSSSGSKVIMQKVTGESMEAERIYPGDYVFVEVFQDGETPRQGELIVTRYIIRDLNDDLGEESISDEYFDGPTIKYFYNKGDCYRLSTRKNTENNEYTIRASHIRPVGRVIGVYRSIDF